MIYTIIPIAAIVVSLAAIIVIIARRFPDVAAIKLDAMPSEKASEVKKRIVGERLARKVKERTGKITERLRPGAKAVSSGFARLYGKAKALEKKYEKQGEPVKLDERQELESVIAGAKRLVERGSYADAEKTFINVISQDPKNETAYRGLGELYFAMKEYGQAAEAFRYLLKLHMEKQQAMAGLEQALSQGPPTGQAAESMPKEAAADYFDLARVYVACEEYDKAAENLEKALEIDPKNPRFLDLYLETALAQADRIKAIQTYETLKQANPENQKLEEFDRRIQEI